MKNVCDCKYGSIGHVVFSKYKKIISLLDSGSKCHVLCHTSTSNVIDVNILFFSLVSFENVSLVLLATGHSFTL